MKRWNGWGNDEVEYHVPASALTFLADVVGPAQAAPTVSWQETLATVPPTRLPHHPLISLQPKDRLCHARGHSLPDWVALRFGQIDAFPDGVAYPQSEGEVSSLLTYARTHDVHVIPYGGGSSVVGHINPVDLGRPILTIAMGRMIRLMAIQAQDQLATFEAGVSGPHLEAQLRAHGYTLGHFPQSFEYSTLGGWIATRSSGQQSLYYGRIEDLFAGGRLLSPAGPFVCPPFPASAAGPDLRHAVLGSEGRLGLITEATVRIRPLPQREDFHAVFFPSWQLGSEAVRTLAQARTNLSMVRLSDPEETHTTLILAGRERLIGLVETLLRTRGVGEGKCLLIFGVTGTDAEVKVNRRHTLNVLKDYAGVHVGRLMGQEWRRSRFRTPYLRNSLWELGYAVDTLETAIPWSQVTKARSAVLGALAIALTGMGERCHAFAHLSHVYASGASLYVTYLFRVAPSANDTLARWRRLKQAASETIIAHGGTISHQHGVGIDHAPYLPAEKGTLGMHTLAAIASAYDPAGIMNPTKLFTSQGMADEYA